MSYCTGADDCPCGGKCIYPPAAQPAPDAVPVAWLYVHPDPKHDAVVTSNRWETPAPFTETPLYAAGSASVPREPTSHMIWAASQAGYFMDDREQKIWTIMHDAATGVTK